jgi:NADH-quinone oxidoreductase subunit L
MYKAKTISPERLGEAVRPVHTLLYRKYYMDDLYEEVITRRFFYAGVARGLDWIDKSVVDPLSNWIGWLGANFGTALGQLQTGQLQEYGAVISVGILTMAGLYLWFL